MGRMITAESLARVPLFANIPEHERASIAARAADVRLRQDGAVSPARMIVGAGGRVTLTGPDSWPFL